MTPMEIIGHITGALAVGMLIGAPIGHASGRNEVHREHNKRMAKIELNRRYAKMGNRYE